MGDADQLLLSAPAEEVGLGDDDEAGIQCGRYIDMRAAAMARRKLCEVGNRTKCD